LESAAGNLTWYFDESRGELSFVRGTAVDRPVTTRCDPDSRKGVPRNGGLDLPKFMDSNFSQ
jgi:hypothetical protein